MNYRIARAGQVHGPYTEEEVREYLATGNLVATDLARTDRMDDWRPLGKILPKVKNPKSAKLNPEGVRSAFPDPPDIPWWVATILEVVTGFVFFVGWDIYQGTWLRRVERNSHALFYYILAALMFAANAPATYLTIVHNIFGGPPVHSSSSALIAIGTFALRIVARFSMRQSLLQHYNIAEPVGLRLSWFMTLVFGGLYFQYHFNRINRVRHAMIPPAELKTAIL